MNRSLAALVILVFCVLLSSSLAEDVQPETYVSGDYRYILAEDGTAEITEWTGYADDLVIPSTLDGHSVTSIGENGFSLCFSLSGMVTSVRLSHKENPYAPMLVTECPSSVDGMTNLAAFPFHSVISAVPSSTRMYR